MEKTTYFNERLTAIMLIVTLSLWVLPLSAKGDGALETLRMKFEEGNRILDDIELATAERRAEKEEKLWQLSRQIFDYELISQMVLASRWDEFTPVQQDEFKAAFTGFLRRTYVPRLMERYNGERVYFVRQNLISPSRADVEAYIMWRNRKITFNLYMVKRQGDWKICDISALGISTIKNYRAQFRWLLLSDSPAQLIARLNARANPAS
jgi:phospholipid transport system substrate-binding protein